MTNLDAFKQALEKELFAHPVILRNPFTRRFREGLADAEALRELVTQFAVFSNHFLVLQAKRMVHAETLEGERAARFILMNECGVGLDPRTGSAEGRSFRTANAHLNWLRELGAELGLAPERLGRWETGSEATRAFLSGLDRTYGSPDGRVGAAASFAVENWAAHGIGGGPEAEAGNFWRELIDGLEGHNRRVRAPAGLPPLPLKFFRYHFELEAGHGAGVWAELEAEARRPDFDPELFLRTGKDALDAVLVFWTGLAEGRRARRPGARRLLSGRRGRAGVHPAGGRRARKGRAAERAVAGAEA